MSTIQKFVFNPIAENTYVIYDESKECIVIDPGCSGEEEQTILAEFIDSHQLKPVRLINTHCHVDHIPGNPFIAHRYQVGLEIHENEVPVLASAPDYAEMFWIKMDKQPAPIAFLKEGDEISFGNKTVLKVLFTPGHSPGSLSFYNEKEKYLISGDVIFQGSVGRYDLPGADGKTLFKSITQKIMKLPDEVKVYSGHGAETTIGIERKTNPFLQHNYFFDID